MLNNNDLPNAEFFRELLAAHVAMIADLEEAGNRVKTSSQWSCTKSVLRQLNRTRDVLQGAVTTLDAAADGTIPDPEVTSEGVHIDPDGDSEEWRKRYFENDRERYLKRHASEAVEAKEHMRRELLRRNDRADWFTTWRLGTDFNTADAFLAWNLFMITNHEVKKRVRPNSRPDLREQFLDFMRTKPAFTDGQRALGLMTVEAIFEVEKQKKAKRAAQ